MKLARLESSVQRHCKSTTQCRHDQDATVLHVHTIPTRVLYSCWPSANRLSAAAAAAADAAAAAAADAVADADAEPAVPNPT